MRFTSVVMEVVQVDSFLICEFSKGDVVTFICNKKLGRYELDSLLYATYEQVINLTAGFNLDARLDAWERVEARNQRDLGWDYRSRGYR